MPVLLLMPTGRLRYFLSGLALALLLLTVCRTVGRLFAVFGRRRVFRGVCTESRPDQAGTALCVQFQDAGMLHHSAAFVTQEAAARELRAGDAAAVAIRTAVFASGSYAQEPSQPDRSGDIVLLRVYRREICRALLKTLLVRSLICGAALAVFLLTVRFCFPQTA